MPNRTAPRLAALASVVAGSAPMALSRAAASAGSSSGESAAIAGSTQTSAAPGADLYAVAAFRGRDEEARYRPDPRLSRCLDRPGRRYCCVALPRSDRAPADRGAPPVREDADRLPGLHQSGQRGGPVGGVPEISGPQPPAQARAVAELAVRAGKPLEVIERSGCHRPHREAVVHAAQPTGTSRAGIRPRRSRLPASGRAGPRSRTCPCAPR